MTWEQVSGIILAGGVSSRLGENKALIQVEGEPLIKRVIRKLRPLVAEIVLVTNAPQSLSFLELPMVQDIYQGVGALGGLHAGLGAICTEYGLVVGCDMPFLNADLMRYMISKRHGYDVVMPRVGKYFEPLHTIYAQRCRHAFEQNILAGQRRVFGACSDMHIRYITEDQVARYDPEHLSFFNVNTPQDMQQMRAILIRESTEKRHRGKSDTRPDCNCRPE